MSEALSALTQWYNVTRDDEPLPYEPLSSEQVKRQRYRMSIDKNVIPYVPSEAHAIVWSMYLEMVPKHIYPQLIYFLKASHQCNTTRLEELTAIMKKYQHLLNKDWVYFVDLQNLCDYKLGLSPSEMIEKVNFWVGIAREHKLPDYDFYEMYELGVKSFLLDHLQPFNKRPLTVTEFLADPMYWATPGSSDGPRLENRRGRRARKSKWASAAKMSLRQLLRLFWTPSKQRNYATTKRELAKARMIISGDLAVYLRMAYLAYLMENVLRAHPHTTLFYNEEQMFDLWSQMITNTKPLDTPVVSTSSPGTPVNMTLDESKFDHEVNTKMNNITWNVIKDHMIPQAAPAVMRPDLDRVILLVIDSTNGGHVIVKDKGNWHYIPIVNGILSGWRLTAFLDTVSNCAKVYAFRLIVIARNEGFSDNQFDPILDSTSQGDDLRSRSPTYLHAKLFSSLYSEAGFQVHPRKFFTSPYTDEFLRKVALYGKELIGYPARGIASLIFRNPIITAPLDGEGRLRELAANWLMSARRTKCAQKIVEHHMSIDLSRSSNIKRDMIREYMHAAANNGGLGLLPLNDKAFEFTPAVLDKDDDVDDPPLADTILSKFGHIGHQIIKKQWLAGVSWTKQPTVVEKFSVKQSEVDIYPKRYDPSTKQLFNMNDASPLWEPPLPDINLPPSEVHVLKELTLRSNRSDIVEIARKWMQPDSLANLVTLKSRCGMKIIREWIKGDLLGVTPESFQAGPILTSKYYAMFARNNLTNLLFNSSVKYEHIRKARLYAEYMVADAVRATPYYVSE